MQRGASIKRILFLLIIFACSVNGVAQGYYFRLPPVNHRFSAGATFSFFSKDPHVVKSIRPLIGYNANYNCEIELFDNSSLIVGLSYVNLGTQFQGYYAAPGHTYAFDGTFAYTHRLRYQMTQLPIGMKLNFNAEADNSITPYLLLGIGFSYIINAKTTIVNDSTDMQVYKGTADLTNENSVLLKKLNSFGQAGFGIQKNNRNNGRALLLEFIYKYDVSRLHYAGYQNSNRVDFRNSNISVIVGMKF
ncbi:MAG TPA: outer membrane beta-barrel protein [Bacteroidia bacterium]|jgi:hypothetical protein|nr:outer membrane beta-barrel protein [Bacteroidia bacterium]